MAKLTKDEINALTTEIRKVIIEQNKKLNNDINLDDFCDELMVIRTIEQLEETRNRKYQEAYEYADAIDKVLLENNLCGIINCAPITNRTGQDPEKFKRARKLEYLIHKGFIKENNVTNQTIQNFLIIHNNGDLKQLLDIAKEKFINQ